MTSVESGVLEAPLVNVQTLPGNRMGGIAQLFNVMADLHPVKRIVAEVTGDVTHA